MWDHCRVNGVVFNYVGIVELVGSSQRLHHFPLVLPVTKRVGHAGAVVDRNLKKCCCCNQLHLSCPGIWVKQPFNVSSKGGLIYRHQKVYKPWFIKILESHCGQLYPHPDLLAAERKGSERSNFHLVSQGEFFFDMCV